MTKHLTAREIRELSQKSRQTLFGDNTAAQRREISTGRNSSVVLENESERPLEFREKPQPEPMSEFDGFSKVNKQIQNALRIMQRQSEHKPPFLFRHEAAYLARVTGGASILEAEDEAIRHELIVKHLLPRAKTNVCLWEITDKGYERLEQKRPQWPSKGGYKHKFVVHRIKHTYTRRGYRGEIEYQRPNNGKLVDLQLSKDDSIFYIEVCASSILKEFTNIEKNLEGDPLPTEIIIAVTERKMKEPLKRAIREMDNATKLSRPVYVVLAGDMIEFMEIYI